MILPSFLAYFKELQGVFIFRKCKVKRRDKTRYFSVLVNRGAGGRGAVRKMSYHGENNATAMEYFKANSKKRTPEA